MTKERAYTPSLVLHVLRNTYGWNAEAIRQARLDAADEIERLQTLLIRVLEDGEPSQDLLQEIDEAVTEPTHEPCEQRPSVAEILRRDAAMLRREGFDTLAAVLEQGASRDASSGERWPKSIAGEAPWCKCPDGDCAGWDEAINHGCCCRVANGR